MLLPFKLIAPPVTASVCRGAVPPTIPLKVTMPDAPALSVSVCAPLMVEEKLMFWLEAPAVVMTTVLFS